MHPATAQLCCRGEGIQALVARLIKTGDPMMAKVLRGLSQYTYSLQADACDVAAAKEESAHAAAEKQRRREERRAALAAAGVDEDSAVAEEQAAAEEESTAACGTVVHTPAGPITVIAPGDYDTLPDAPVEYEYPLEGVWGSHIRPLVKLAKAADAENRCDILVEVLGLLANLTPQDMASSDTHGYGALLDEDAEFVDLLARRLRVSDRTHPGSAEPEMADDVLLEAIQFISAAALDPEAAAVLASPPLQLTRALGDLLVERIADADILLQAAAAIGRLLHHEATRKALMERSKSGLVSKVPHRLVELLGHVHPGIVAEAAASVDIMIELDRAELPGGGSMAYWPSLLSRRFQLYNREWCAAQAPQRAAGGPSSLGSGSSTTRPGISAHSSASIYGASAAANTVASVRSRAGAGAPSYDSEDGKLRNDYGEDDDGIPSPEARAMMDSFMLPQGRGGTRGDPDAPPRGTALYRGGSGGVSGWDTSMADDHDDNLGDSYGQQQLV
jgi:hypothetical protein